MRAWWRRGCLPPDPAVSTHPPCRPRPTGVQWAETKAFARRTYCAKIVTSGKSVSDRFKARKAASDSCAAPSPGIRSTAIVAPLAVSTRPGPAVFTRPARSQNPGSVTLPKATAVLPKTRSPAGLGGASAAVFCAVVVVSSAAAVRADAGGRATPSDKGRDCGRCSIASTAVILPAPFPKGRLAQAGRAKRQIRAGMCFILRR
jgi:hypothetical protein